VIAQLKGKTHFDWRSEGLVCDITLRVASTAVETRSGERR